MWVLLAALVTYAVLIGWAMPRSDSVPKTIWSRFISVIEVIAGLSWLVFLIADSDSGRTVAGLTAFVAIWLQIANTAVAILRKESAQVLVVSAYGESLSDGHVDAEPPRNWFALGVLSVASVLAAIAALVSFGRGEAAIGWLPLVLMVASVAGIYEAFLQRSRA
jgi:hypothetical protein